MTTNLLYAPIQTNEDDFLCNRNLTQNGKMQRKGLPINLGHMANRTSMQRNVQGTGGRYQASQVKIEQIHGADRCMGRRSSKYYI